ncbi:M56 family peptidase [Cryobacterium fucosi]|uniref:M56 family peptidase n=1 Tax=Cryobacterium fucosi TaxID=1259157 RepID=A0A4R9BFP0_9MICO|nr:M56 family peptidase [Cryobacterium fucosi]
MPTTALVLGALALALAWPLPILLSRARWPARSPGLALVLWQSIALAGGLSMIGALLAYGLLGFGTSPLAGIRSLSDHPGSGAVPVGMTFGQVLALAAGLLLAGHLLLNLAATFLRARVQLRRHHHLVALLSEPLADRPGTRVIDHEAPVAYCLPGATTSATVLSRGLISLLDADQLRAVVAHERAHLLQRHHVVLLAFRSWRSALPWFPIATRAETAVGLLVEMLADDQARREVDDRTLATAIALVGSAHGPVTGAREPGGPATRPETGTRETDAASLAGPDHPFDLLTPRLRRLVVPTPRLRRHQGFGVLAASAGLLALPTLLLLG